MRTLRAKPPPPASADWAYFLDVDGSLIELAATPAAVRVDADLLRLLADLQARTEGALALVSGRTLASLDELFGVLGLPMAGQHGLERRTASGQLCSVPAPLAAKQAIKHNLAPLLARHPGLMLEEKSLTLALHYRRVPHLAATVHRLMRREQAAIGDALELQFGKCVVEIKPPGRDKGTAIAAYLTEAPFCQRRPVFVGDDINDEHGFAAVNRLDGISIKVGRGPSCARYRLPNVAAVRHWLSIEAA